MPCGPSEQPFTSHRLRLLPASTTREEGVKGMDFFLFFSISSGSWLLLSRLYITWAIRWSIYQNTITYRPKKSDPINLVVAPNPIIVFYFRKDANYPRRFFIVGVYLGAVISLFSITRNKNKISDAGSALQERYFKKSCPFNPYFVCNPAAGSLYDLSGLILH